MLSLLDVRTICNINGRQVALNTNLDTLVNTMTAV